MPVIFSPYANTKPLQKLKNNVILSDILCEYCILLHGLWRLTDVLNLVFN